MLIGADQVAPLARAAGLAIPATAAIATAMWPRAVVSAIVGGDGRLSTSKSVVAAWVIALAAVAVTVSVDTIRTAAPDPGLPIGLFVAAGAAALAALAAKLAVVHDRLPKSPARFGSVRLRQLVCDDDDRLDFVDLQFAVVASIAIAVVLARVAQGALQPGLPDALAATACIAAALYAARKLVGDPPPRLFPLPARGRSGAIVTLRGTGLRVPGAPLAATRVFVGGHEARVRALERISGADRLEFVVPPGLAPGDCSLRIVRADGREVPRAPDASLHFEVLEPAGREPAAEVPSGGDSSPPPDSPRDAAAASPKGVPWKAIGAFLGSTSALAVWVAIVGGGKEWAHLAAADLPTTQTLERLPRQLLLVIGLQTLLFPLLLGGLVSLLIYLSWKAPERKERVAAQAGAVRLTPKKLIENLRPVETIKEFKQDYGSGALAATAAAVALGVIAVILIAVHAHWWQVVGPLAAGAIAALIALVTLRRGRRGVALVLFALGAIVAIAWPLGNELRFEYALALPIITTLALVLVLGAISHWRESSLGVAAVLFAGIAVWAGAISYVDTRGQRRPRFDRLDLAMKNGDAPVRLLIGQTDDEVVYATFIHARRQVARVRRADLRSLAWGPSIPIACLEEEVDDKVCGGVTRPAGPSPPTNRHDNSAPPKIEVVSPYFSVESPTFNVTLPGIAIGLPGITVNQTVTGSGGSPPNPPRPDVAGPSIPDAPTLVTRLRPGERIRVELGAFSEKVTGVVSFTTVKAFKLASGRHHVRLATVGFRAARDQTVWLEPGLSPFASRLVAREHALGVKATVTARDSLGNAKSDVFRFVIAASRR